MEVNDKTIALIDKVGENLMGTCKSADQEVAEVFEDEDLTLMDLPMELLIRLDEHTMECTTCNWWYEPHELDENQTCRDCGGEFDDDED